MTAAIEKLFRSLSNRQRLKIIEILRRKPTSVVGLSELLKLSYKSTHQHVNHLMAVGFLDKERQSNIVLYSIDKDLPKFARILLDLLK